MSKRTVYAYYEDKDALYRAAVRRAIDRYTIPLERLEAVETDDLEESLKAVAHLRVENLATESGIRFQRVLNANAHYFPDLFDSAVNEVIGPTVAFLSDLFTRRDSTGEIQVSDPERAAFAFLSMVLRSPARALIVADRLDGAEISAHIDFTVGLFLNGIRRR